MAGLFANIINLSGDGRSVKCPRCWHWHGAVENFGHEPGGNEREKLCDRCSQIILENFPKHPSVPHILLAQAAQREKYTAKGSKASSP